MNATELIDALRQDTIDQRAVTDHLMTLAKKLKTATAAASALERSSSVATDASVSSSEVRRTPENCNNNATVAQQLQEGHANDDEGLRHEGPDNDQGAVTTSNIKAMPKPGDGLLLELIRGFRAGMLRVDSNLRAAMFRAVRYLVRTSEDAEVIRRQRFGLFIALALAREQYNLWERMQALKLVKQIMAVDASKLPREVVRTVVAVSGHKEDNFRRVCLETLLDLAVADPRMVAHANGLRVLLAAAIDPVTQDLADPLITTLISIVEDPSIRKYVRPYLELHQLLSGFTDIDTPPGPDRAYRWKASRKALVVAMRSWAGVHLLCSDPRGLVTLMRLLRDPSASFSEDAGLQDSILETLSDICDPLMGVCSTTSSPDARGRQHGGSFVDKLFTPFSGGTTTYSHKRTGSGLHTGTSAEQHNVLLSYATVLCAAFVHCGLIPSLTALAISASSEELRTKATSLLVDVLHLCSVLLSQNQCTRLLSMPGLVQIAAESPTGFMTAGKGGAQSCHLTRSRASRASDLIRLLHGALGAGASGDVPSYLGQQAQMDQSTCTIGGLMQKVYDASMSFQNEGTDRSRAWEPTGTLEQMRKELRLNIESTVEKSVMDNQMNKSKVLMTKDWTKWDWDVVDDIVQDILPHPPRLADALRSKWIKRVSGFYRFVGAGSIGTSTDRGGGGGLHNMRWDRDNIRHVACAGRLYSVLLEQPEGVHFLQTDARGSILQEIVKELQALVTRRWSSAGSLGKITSTSKVFDMESCQRRLSGGYITLLFGVAAASDAGRELLANTELRSHLANMGCQPELDYMSRLILTTVDLTSNKFFARDLLNTWMASGSSHLRLFAVNLMRSVLRDAIAANRDLKNTALGTLGGGTSSADNNGLELWCIETLVTQLSRDEPAIVQAVLSVLEEAAQDDHCLRTLVLTKPCLINKPGATNLLMRFMSIPEGIHYLDQLGWVERMLHEWKRRGHMTAYAENLAAIWKAHVNEVGHVEDTLDMEPSSESGGASGGGTAVSIPIRTDDILSSQPEDAAATGLWDGHELLLLLGLPWNVEVIVSRDSAPAARSQLRLDTFVDALPREEAQGSRTVGSGPHGAKTMVVRGVLVDGAGKPTCHPLEAQLALHARLCVGACAVDRWGNVQSHATASPDNQAASFRKNRGGRSSRSQWSPQNSRADHGVYGASNMYRGIQGMQEFGQSRDMSDDPSDWENQLVWSTCRPHQRVAVPQVVVNPGSDNGKSGSRPGSLGMRTISPLAKTMHEEEHGAESGDTGGEDIGASAPESAPRPTDPRTHERVVNVSNETARWIFTNQPEPDNMITMQVVETTSVTYLKAVEFTLSFKDMGSSAILLPPHLYGELAKTERGCELLRQYGDLKNLLRTARNCNSAAADREGALWAVAHVSRWPLGLQLLEQIQENVVGILLSMCTSEPHLSVWGTSFSVMSLVSRTARGREAIRDAGWESARDPSTHVFLPQDPAVLFQPVRWPYEGSLTQGLDEQPNDPVIERLWDRLTVQEAAVLQQVTKLSSHISRKEAIRKLSRLRRDKAHRESFTSSLPVFLLVHQLLADYSFALPMRRYIFDIFDQVPPKSNWEPYVG